LWDRNQQQAQHCVSPVEEHTPASGLPENNRQNRNKFTKHIIFLFCGGKEEISASLKNLV